MSDFPITIFHNPACGTSRNTLAVIRAAGYAPEVVEYLKAGWTRPQLEKLVAQIGGSARDILRVRGTPAEELGLTAPGAGEGDILDAMIAHPIMVERPIVVTPKGARVCRPYEQVLDLLEARPASFTKDNGEVVALPAKG